MVVSVHFSGSEWVPWLWFRTSINENDKLSYWRNVKFVRGSLLFSSHLIPSISVLFVSPVAISYHRSTSSFILYYLRYLWYFIKNHNIWLSLPLIFVCYYTTNRICVIHCWHSASIDIRSKLSVEQISLIYYRSSIADTLSRDLLEMQIMGMVECVLIRHV